MRIKDDLESITGIVCGYVTLQVVVERASRDIKAICRVAILDPVAIGLVPYRRNMAGLKDKESIVAIVYSYIAL